METMQNMMVTENKKREVNAIPPKEIPAAAEITMNKRKMTKNVFLAAVTLSTFKGVNSLDTREATTEFSMTHPG